MIQGILLDEENRVKGAWGIGILDNDYFFIDAPAIIMATGGAGQVFLENFSLLWLREMDGQQR